MKTLTLRNNLAEKVELTAKEMRVSIDKVVSLALEDFLKRKQNNDLLKAINDAYKDAPTAEEREEIRRMKNKSLEALDEWK